MQQPMARPTFLCRPDMVSGTPVALESLPFAAEIPSARLHENENPNFLPISLLPLSANVGPPENPKAFALDRPWQKQPQLICSW